MSKKFNKRISRIYRKRKLVEKDNWYRVSEFIRMLTYLSISLILVFLCLPYNVIRSLMTAGFMLSEYQMINNILNKKYEIFSKKQSLYVTLGFSTILLFYLLLYNKMFSNINEFRQSVEILPLIISGVTLFILNIVLTAFVSFIIYYKQNFINIYKNHKPGINSVVVVSLIILFIIIRYFIK